MLVAPYAVSSCSFQWQPAELKEIFQMTDYYKRCLFPFSCIYLCRSLWKMLHIFSRAHWVTQWGKSTGGRVEGEGQRRAGCCTCLLPWGFWRSDYAVMWLREWRICFRKGGSGKKIECAWAGASVTNYVAGAFILDRVSKALLRPTGSKALPQRPLMFSYYLTVQIKLRAASPWTVRRKIHFNKGKTIESWWRLHNCMFPR